MIGVIDDRISIKNGYDSILAGMSGQNLYKVGIYLRLSRDDENEGDSQSIKNQREFLTKYVKAQDNWLLVDIYIDDGYTGTNYNRHKRSDVVITSF